jgi:hypothetical protein
MPPRSRIGIAYFNANVLPVDAAARRPRGRLRNRARSLSESHKWCEGDEDPPGADWHSLCLLLGGPHGPRLARQPCPGSGAVPMLEPTPELPDDTLISRLQFPTRIQNVLSGAGLRTVGEVREASDHMLLSLPDLGPDSVTHLRETLGLPSGDGVRPRKK